jgi:hypothetical protein
MVIKSTVGVGRGVFVEVGGSEGVYDDTGVLVDDGRLVLVEIGPGGGGIMGMVGVGCCLTGAAQPDNKISRRSGRISFCILILTIQW